MTFNPYESSVEDGQPVELYQFTIGAAVYLYTSNENDILVTGIGLHTAIPIQRGKITASREKNGDRLEVRLPSSNPVAQNYVNSVPGERAFLTVRRMHQPDVDQQTITIFIGTVQQAQFQENRTIASLQVASLSSSDNRQMPRLTFQGLCNHMLYDDLCQIDETDAAFRFTFPVTAVSGNTITCAGANAAAVAAGLPDFFEWGFITFQGDYRLITAQAGDLLTVQIPFSLSPLGESVMVNAGCKHRLREDCRDKFANVENYGGFSFVPLKNPFGPGGI